MIVEQVAGNIFLWVFLGFIISTIILGILFWIVISFMIKRNSEIKNPNNCFGFNQYFKVPPGVIEFNGASIEVTNNSIIYSKAISKRKELLFKDISEVLYGKNKFGLWYIAFKTQENNKSVMHLFVKGLGILTKPKESIDKLITLINKKVKIRYIEENISIVQFELTKYL